MERERFHKAPQVYFLKCGEYTKIGRTTGPIGERIKAMAVGNPYPIELLFGIGIPYASDKARSLEELFHNFFAAKRVRGEWFNLDENDLFVIDNTIDYIVNLMSVTV